MSHALQMIVKLPHYMGSSVICDLNLARYATLDALIEARHAAEKELPRLGVCVLGTLEFELGIQLPYELIMRAE